MASKPEQQQPDRTTGNVAVSDTDAGGTRPAPSRGQPVPRPKVQSGDQNRDPPHGTDR